MKNYFKNLLALTTLASLVVAQSALAQTASSSPLSTSVASSSIAAQAPAAPDATSTPPTSSIPEVVATSTNIQEIYIQSSVSPALQDTANAQPAVTSKVLESTANPETATTSQSISIPLVIDPATSSTTASQPIVPLPSVDPGVPVDQSTTALHIVALKFIPDTATVDKISQEVTVQELTPQPDFTFALTGKQVPTQRNIEDKNGTVLGEETVATPLGSQVDNSKGEVLVSGSCADTNFVVLLFKNATDYAQDPRSYVVNRAYPCVGGVFSYSVSNLPSTLPNGNYYLLIGEEGNKGSWKPITSQTEITITKN